MIGLALVCVLSLIAGMAIEGAWPARAPDWQPEAREWLEQFTASFPDERGRRGLYAALREITTDTLRRRG